MREDQGKSDDPAVSKFEEIKELVVSNIPGKVEVLQKRGKKDEVVVSIRGSKEEIDSIALAKKGDRLSVIGEKSDGDSCISSKGGQSAVGNGITQCAAGNNIHQSVTVTGNSVVCNVTQSAFSRSGRFAVETNEENCSGEKGSSLKIQIKVPKDIQIVIDHVSKKIEVKDLTDDLAVLAEAGNEVSIGKIIGDLAIDAGSGSNVSIKSITGNLVVEADSRSTVSVSEGEVNRLVISAGSGGVVSYGGSAVVAVLEASSRSVITVERVTGAFEEDKSSGGEIIINKRK